MLSTAHQLAISRISDDPELLILLADKLLGKTLPGPLERADSTVRFNTSEEVRPDLLFARTPTGRWDAVEIQRRIDLAKVHRWPVLLNQLQKQQTCMGDLWVLTACSSAARWAHRACDQLGPNGTVVRATPVVLLIGAEHVDVLLDREHPTLAFFAAWAMQNRYGPEAEHVVERALRMTARLPTALRQAQRRD
jgi:hypothetical protein